MRYPLVLDLAADGIPVAVTCRALGFSKQAFYAWKNNPVSQRDWDEAHLINAAVSIHHDNPAFGYRFIADELAGLGITAAENKVARLCSQQQIWSVFARKRAHSRKAGPPVHDDLVNRHFTADRPDELWLTDITEHPTTEGKLYLCAIKDACSGRIGGYSMDSRMKASLAVSALRKRNRAALASGNGSGAFGLRQSVPRPRLHPPAARQRADRVGGPGRGLRRQRGHGIVLRPAPKEHPGPPPLGNPRPAARGHHHLDRAHLPSPAPPAPARQANTHRIRDAPHQGRTRGLTHPPGESTKAGAVPVGVPQKMPRQKGSFRRASLYAAEPKTETGAGLP